ncbi:enoyl-(acyl-carrier-protein) reductase II [Thermosipho africanus Ob7]|jgi:enoyl-[acyl-carrier protein] reductase II|uniref:Putative enoyl-(Acyl-carrier-protein) reductase II n=1 Tax=Thermosipho africanus (strain TCF52B) TaxID=484019 RepID=B7IDZ8_THEAB|nr:MULTISPECIES: enoyl-[acyl-carrier-protein] reductase FabK [Thermosipho]ACJ76225.1 putative enoyl-(acyl-carrier-protein) reductase II [Thermosipho africanus TCF52B]MBZ4649527.1 putative enoyl-(acyl-carrier-protein) reductase [Thermosipho sp. (in: thermotogales)]MDK2838755.1 enoyl-[acyl-carrier protein] reductase [Thermosipho sp. (in: thermotogales)]MDK2900500.1 enoyl-[acyl-carrier protein] reductase [Thermosipho sp. (in: thermotogales)]RDI92008.1 enoyl-(acyl-carrier-protein) reductase II [Th
MNRICKLFNIKYPILMGGMSWAGTPRLAAAVSNAGGLGIIGAGAMKGEDLQNAIDEVRKHTDKPFGVNIILVSPFADELVEVVLKNKVPVVTFGAGNPTKYINDLKSTGIKVVPVVASENLARLVERTGADAVIAEGMESGGHIGEVTTFVLVNSVSKSVKIPVIAAGGIADGKGMAAAFALGAEGIQMGTRFIASKEAEVHENFKNLIIKSGIRDTIITGASLGHSARVIKTKFAKIVKTLEVESPQDAENILVGSLRKAVQEGNIEQGSFMAGQSVGLIKDIKPVHEIIEEIMEEFNETVRKLGEVRL